ncbi:DUF4335 domain-containing protein [Synechococcus sp. A10-1-5-1]|uniref:DUF4335 domain-containing protein n=1 Tax=Synechococcus sp. A10-1-5-1 TaxID=2936507 RepID=UPI0020010061|nr:DUF4335 domain-containing protein [Synechococcus sp. A10-1-5-1]UPM50745.1 DUF4335 domain-containing protein [Synechococcus sp. A10-1-5-1]
MKLTTRYEQTSCRLIVEGLPDLSAGQSSSTIGILTGFTMGLAGHTELEGQREHLQALLFAVIPYARHLLSGVPKAFGAADAPVAIAPGDGCHQLELRSSQPNTPPLTLRLDDAELSDLVRCLDQLRLDSRLALPFEAPPLLPLARKELRHRQPLLRRIAAPLTGVVAVAVSAALIAMLPTPKPASETVPELAPPAKGG